MLIFTQESVIEILHCIPIISSSFMTFGGDKSYFDVLNLSLLILTSFLGLFAMQS